MKPILAAYFTNYSKRKLEWSIAMYSVLMGAFYMMPWTSFATNGYLGVLFLMTEFQWGLVYFITGILHNVALHINGRASWTPFARAATLFINSQVFLAFGLAFANPNPAGSGVGNYVLIALLFCGPALWSASEDCGREVKIWREARRHV